MRRQSQSAQLRAYLERYGMAPLSDDLRFLIAVLGVIPHNAHEWLTSHYAGRWLACMERSEVGHRRQNEGRWAANQWVVSILKRRSIPIPSSQVIKGVRL
jgi:hypothetical protein